MNSYLQRLQVSGVANQCAKSDSPRRNPSRFLLIGTSESNMSVPINFQDICNEVLLNETMTKHPTDELVVR